MFLYKNQFLLIFSFLSIPIELWESTAAIFQQSAGYVFPWMCFDDLFTIRCSSKEADIFVFNSSNFWNYNSGFAWLCFYLVDKIFAMNA